MDGLKKNKCQFSSNKMELKWKLFSFIWKLCVSVKRLYRTQKHQLFAISTLIVMAVGSFLYLYSWAASYRLDNSNLNLKNTISILKLREIIKNEKGTGCTMPKLDPFSKEAMQFFENVPEITCETKDWVECYHAECRVVDDILNKMKDVACIYKEIIYVNDDLYYIGKAKRMYGNERYILTKSDHVKVSCSGSEIEGSKYATLPVCFSLGFISSRWFGYKAGFRPVPPKPAPPGRNRSLNVLIVCFDSTSRNGFIRNMPRSYKYLIEELKATVLKSYNIVEDGTAGAMFPILTGKREDELPGARKGVDNHKYIDYQPFIFHVLKDDGYRTAYLEDMPWIGTFQYSFNGFRHQPADHYLRSFFLEEGRSGRKWWSGVKERHCIGGMAQHNFMLNLTAQFFNLDGQRFCLTFISDITHEENILSVADDDFAYFLRSFKDRGKLEDTLLVVMGDHGPRFSAIRNTDQGKIEERLPLMAIRLPEKFIRDRPSCLSALQTNQGVLTSPFDLHASLLDFLDLIELSNKYMVPGSDLPRGMSFLKRIPKTRTCGEAGIRSYWCACATWYNVSNQDPIYKPSAKILADYINGITAEERSKCAKRKLLAIEWVRVRGGVSGTKQVWANNGLQSRRIASDNYVQAKIVMSPGNAVFEGSMQYFVKNDFFMISEKDISRVNTLEGDQAVLALGWSQSIPQLDVADSCLRTRITAQLEIV